jgi:uncharacterized membrane protein
MNRLKLFSASLILLAFYLIALSYLAVAVPADAAVPIHWNAQGVIDNYTSKSNALIFAFAMNIGLFLLMYLMPYFSPKYKQQAGRFDQVLPGITFMLLLFLSLLNIYGLSYPLGADRLPLNPVLVLIGLMLLLLGNMLPKVPRNFFVGIRTPWTISDEDNWYKTHRLGGLLFVIGGILLAMKGILSLSPTLQTLSTWIVMSMLLLPLPYSFLLYLKRKK